MVNKRVRPALLMLMILGCSSAPQLWAIDATLPQQGDADVFNLRDYIADRLICKISKKTDFRVQRINSTDMKTIQLTLVDGSVDGMMIMRINGLSLNTADVLSQPLDTTLTLEMTVLDGRKNVIYSKKVRGCYEIQFDALKDQQGMTNLIETVTENALSQFAEDPELKQMIARLKYGAIGNLAKFI